MQYFTKAQWPATTFVSLGLIVLLSNIFQSGITWRRQQLVRAERPYVFRGNKYLGLNEFLTAGSRVGYLTDRNQDVRAHAMEFAQAEYVLAPVTLDLNGHDHEYLILAYSSPEKTLETVKAKSLIPLKQNRFGIVLAKNPGFRRP